MVEYAWTMCWIAPPVSLECVLEDPVAVPSCPASNWPVPSPTPPPEVPEDRSKDLKNHTVLSNTIQSKFYQNDLKRRNISILITVLPPDAGVTTLS